MKCSVQCAIKILEKIFPSVTEIFLFNNAPCHKKFPDDPVNASNTNVYPGGKQPALRDGLWEDVQKMGLPDGTPKLIAKVTQYVHVHVYALAYNKQVLLILWYTVHYWFLVHVILVGIII